MKHLPTWFPGAGFHKDAAFNLNLAQRMRAEPFDMVKRVMVRAQSRCMRRVSTPFCQASGKAKTSMATRLLSQQELDTAGVERDEFIMNCCAVVYSGASPPLAAPPPH